MDSVFDVRMKRDGTTVECVNVGWMVIEPYDELGLVGEWNSEVCRADKYVLVGMVYAIDREQAIKIANEKRAQLITRGMWPEKG
jgi:hypothetical protein